MTYLLDTNACIAAINGRPASIRDRLIEVISSGETLAASAITVFELWYGVAKSAREHANNDPLDVFLAPLQTLSFD